MDNPAALQCRRTAAAISVAARLRARPLRQMMAAVRVTPG